MGAAQACTAIGKYDSCCVSDQISHNDRPHEVKPALSEVTWRLVFVKFDVLQARRRFASCRLDADDTMSRSRLHASETQQLSWPMPLSAWSCFGAAVNQ